MKYLELYISPFNKDFGFLDASRAFTRNNTKLLKDFWIRTVNVEEMILFY